MKSIKVLILGILSLISFGVSLDYTIEDGNVVFEEADLSSTIDHLTIEEVEFFIGKNDAGTVLSHKNACQACGPVGFVQNGSAMKCNGCGLEYDISTLGVDNPGACWPFYIPNKAEDGKVLIALSDLGIETATAKGFKTLPFSYSVVKSGALHFAGLAEGRYTVKLFTLSGKELLKKESLSENGQLTFSHNSDFSQGARIVTISGAGVLHSFVIK